MPAPRKINLEKVKASLATPCPQCGHEITPAEVLRNSRHLEATITQETFDSFDGGSSVRISVSQGSGCPITGNSAALDLVIN